MGAVTGSDLGAGNKILEAKFSSFSTFHSTNFNFMAIGNSINVL
jgi:hypothetical protein